MTTQSQYNLCSRVLLPAMRCAVRSSRMTLLPVVHSATRNAVLSSRTMMVLLLAMHYATRNAVLSSRMVLLLPAMRYNSGGAERRGLL
eukprot:3940877-Rhodomonas_salina.8